MLILLSLQVLALFVLEGTVVQASDLEITEIHYNDVPNGQKADDDNIEISGPAGEDVSNCILEFHSDASGFYASMSLTGTIPNDGATGFGALTFDPQAESPAIDIETEPAGIALVCDNAVVEFLSYGGTLTPSSGVANGTSSVDMLVTESQGPANGNSLQKTDAGWIDSVSAGATPSFGTVNDGLTIGGVTSTAAAVTSTEDPITETTTTTSQDSTTEAATTATPDSTAETPASTSPDATEAATTVTPDSTTTAVAATSLGPTEATTATEQSDETTSATDEVTTELGTDNSTVIAQHSTTIGPGSNLTGSTNEETTEMSTAVPNNATEEASSTVKPVNSNPGDDKTTTEKTLAACLPLFRGLLEPLRDAVEKLPLVEAVKNPLVKILCGLRGIVPV